MQAARRAAGRGQNLEGSFEKFSLGADEEFNVDLSPLRDSERFEDAEGAAGAAGAEEVRWSRRQPGARPAAPRGRAGAFRQKEPGEADAEGAPRGPRGPRGGGGRSRRGRDDWQTGSRQEEFFDEWEDVPDGQWGSGRADATFDVGDPETLDMLFQHAMDKAQVIPLREPRLKGLARAFAATEAAEKAEEEARRGGGGEAVRVQKILDSIEHFHFEPADPHRRHGEHMPSFVDALLSQCDAPPPLGPPSHPRQPASLAQPPDPPSHPSHHPSRPSHPFRPLRFGRR